MSIHTFESRMETGSVKAYGNAGAHLSDEFVKLDARIQLQVLKLRDLRSHKKFDEFAGLYIAEEDIDKVLEKDSKGQDTSDSASEDAEIISVLNQIERFQAAVSARVEESLRQGIILPLYQLAYLFHLTPFELDAILICLAPELDLKYETLYAYLHNDVTKKQPSVNLILELLCPTGEQRMNARTAFYVQAPLLKYALLKLVDDAEQKPLLSKCLKLDERIVNFLLGFNLLDARLTDFAEIITP
jgi:hypothetical protein